MKRLTPSVTVRKYCINCFGNSPEAMTEIKKCVEKRCNFYPYRLGHSGKVKLKVIKLFCINCMNNQPRLVSGCSDIDCLLFNYRLGKSGFKRPNAPRPKFSQSLKR